MKRMFSFRFEKEKEKMEPLLHPSIHDLPDQIKMTKLVELVDKRIRKLDAALVRCREQIKRTRPGPTREAIKDRAMRLLKQKRIYEGHLDSMRNRIFNLDQVAFAAMGIKDAQQSSSKGRQHSSRQFRQRIGFLIGFCRGSP